MAARYWVTGGTGNTNSTTNWSTTSGGASGASVPGSTDDAIWDANSGTGTVNVNATLSVLNFDSTNFGGTFAGSSQITMNGGTLVWGSGVTITWTGNISCGTGASGTTFTSNGKGIKGTLVIATGFPNPGTLNFVDDFSCGSIQHTTAAAVVNLDGADIYVVGNNITMAASSGRIIQGTSTIRLVTTNTTLSISILGTIKNNVVINATNAINQISTVNIEGGTWTYTAGTWNAGVQVFTASNCTLNLAGITLGVLTCSVIGSTVTLTSTLTCNTVSIQQSTTFAGTHGFVAGTLTIGTNSIGGRTVTLKAGVTYEINVKLNPLSIGYNSRCTINSDSPGNKAILKCPIGTDTFPAFVNVTDIDSSGGRLCKTFMGNLSNTVNWLSVTSDVPTANVISIN